MKRIGFIQPKCEKSGNRSLDRIAVLPDPASNLTLRDRTKMVEGYLGSPRLRILQGDPPQICDDDLSVRRTYAPFSRSIRHDILIAQTEGTLIFERCLLWDCLQTPAFDGDEFLRHLIQFSLRAVNGVSLFSAARSSQIVVCTEGLEGSPLIFNPHRYVSRTICRSTAQRSERLEVSEVVDLIGLLRSALFKLANEVLNTFQSDRRDYCAYIREDEFAQLFDTERTRLTLSDGPLSSADGRPLSVAVAHG